MSKSGFANLDHGRRTASIEQMKAINEAVKPVIGDRLMYLVTGKSQTEYLISHVIDDDLIDRADCLSKLEDWLVDMKLKSIIRYKGSVTELVSIFANRIKRTPTSNGDSKTA